MRLYKSGFNTYWRTSLPDMTPAECDKFVRRLSRMELKLCDAIRGCDNPAFFYVNFHGCEEFCACVEHVNLWINEVTKTVEANGQIYCQGCALYFKRVSFVMRWRRI